MGIREDIRAIARADAAQVRDLHARHLNPKFMEALGLIGWGRDLVRADGLSLWDADGREYLDFLAGYGAVSLGHNHPEVRAALEEVLAVDIPHFTLVTTQPLAAELGRRLTRLVGGELSITYFASSGSEAVEGGLKLARAATHRTRFVSAERGYHGTSMGALSVTGSARLRGPFEPLLAGCARVAWGDVAAVDRELRRRDVAAVILEPLQAEGGMHVAPPGWLADVAGLCKRYGTLLVLDEIQTGLGRTGRFLACEEAGVVPDVLLLAKGLSGGLAPISAMMTRPALWKRAYGTLARYDLHCTTFSGGPLACAAGLATLSLIERDGLVAHAAAMGRRLEERLRAACAGHALVRAVRGRGLLWGIELAGASAGIAADLVGQWLVLGLLERGVLTQVCSDAGNVVRAQPPLTVTPEAIDRMGVALADTLADHATSLTRSLAGAGAAVVRGAAGRLLA